MFTIYKVVRDNIKNKIPYRHLAEGGEFMSIASDLIRGHTDTIILAQLIAGDSYGYKINKAIQDRTGQEYELKEATLYTAFKRLEEAGCIRSYWGDENSGARRRYYTVTSYGRQTHKRLKDEWDRAKKLIDILITEGGQFI